MSNARKCDVCGSYFDVDNDKLNKLDIFINTVYESAEDIHTYDLCPDCADAVINLIKSLGCKNDKDDETLVSMNDCLDVMQKCVMCEKSIGLVNAIEALPTYEIPCCDYEPGCCRKDKR